MKEDKLSITMMFDDESNEDKEIKTDKNMQSNLQSPKLRKLQQSKSSDADYKKKQKDKRFSEQSTDIDSFSSPKMSDEQRTSILNEKKKLSKQRKQSTTMTKYIE